MVHAAEAGGKKKREDLYTEKKRKRGRISKGKRINRRKEKAYLEERGISQDHHTSVISSSL